jgi:hypothetical protein
MTTTEILNLHNEGKLEEHLQARQQQSQALHNVDKHNQLVRETWLELDATKVFIQMLNERREEVLCMATALSHQVGTEKQLQLYLHEASILEKATTLATKGKY